LCAKSRQAKKKNLATTAKLITQMQV